MRPGVLIAVFVLFSPSHMTGRYNGQWDSSLFFREVSLMSVTLELPKELEHCLAEGAARLGISVEDYTLRILERHVPEPTRRAAAVALLQSWIDQGDEDEQRETGDFLIRSLDEDRPAERKLFPPELEGVSW